MIRFLFLLLPCLAHARVSGPIANMTRCFYEKEILCYVGNTCLHYQQMETHRFIESIPYEEIIRYNNRTRQQIIDCNVAAILEDPGVQLSAGPPRVQFDFRTTKKNGVLGLKIATETASREISPDIDSAGNLRKPELICRGCTYDRGFGGISDIDHATEIWKYRKGYQFDRDDKKGLPANLSRCFSEDSKHLRCFVGDNCLTGKLGPHSKIVEFEDMKNKYELIRKYSGENKANRERIEICDVGATVRAGYRSREYIIDFHTTANNKQHSIDFGNLFGKSHKRELKIDPTTDAPYCTPSCTFETSEFQRGQGLFYWRGSVRPGKPRNLEHRKMSESIGRRRANISRCFEGEEVACFAGDACALQLETHLEIQGIYHDYQQRLMNDTDERSLIEGCDVAGIMTKFANESLAYEIEFHTIPDKLRPKFTALRHDRNIVQLELKNGKIFCVPECAYEDKRTGDDRNNFLYYFGVMRFENLHGTTTTAKSGEVVEDDVVDDEEDGDSKVDPVAVKKEKEQEKVKEKEESADQDTSKSRIGQIFIIVGCSLVGCILLAIIIGTIIQRRQAAKHKHRREALQKATNNVPNSDSGSVRGNRKGVSRARSRAEAAPLVDSTQLSGSDEPRSEVTTSSQFSPQTV